MIKIENLSKVFRTEEVETTALNNVSLEVKKGEFVAIMGPSGCGKTTLLRLIAGLDQPTSGEVIADGEVVKKPSGDRAVIFQQYSLFPWLTVLENVMFGLNLKKDRTKEENLKAAERYLESVGLIDFKDSYPHELSGGMKQRVAIIRSLLNHSPILLMDEPFSALDKQTSNHLRKELQDIWMQTHKTIFFITHSVEEAVYLGDKVVVMSGENGGIRNIVPINLERPRHVYDEAFIAYRHKILEEIQGGDY